ncbi:AbiH family protein [Bifidobacterium sp. ESL0682]|uniref:AbiH family protein n=1 Tax=Bifidobacterium sp. ESL0682 TaxID=2983212 RepID=UPI0023F99A22|nr:AbiH family protein [Bifidobacterium sp. ESL0682]WEV41999.1 AbiH family protein [Bifidobacterium sp. ESL0682]
MTNQLIILGNGFDVACGLSSSYTDFFRDRYSLHKWNPAEGANLTDEDTKLAKHMLPNDGSINADFWKIDNPNFWDLVFLTDCQYGYNYDDGHDSATTWHDVETLIQQILDSLIENQAANSDGPELWTISDWISSCINRLTYCDAPFPIENHSQTQFEFSLARCLETYLDYRKVSPTGDAYYSSNAFITLKSELNNLEQAFSKYLSQVCVFAKHPGQYAGSHASWREKTTRNEQEKYRYTANKLLNLIKGVDNQAGDSTSILSFNYTTPFGKNETTRNIHGTTDNAIFGIDPALTNVDDLGISPDGRKIFTKDFRVLELHTNHRYEKILHPDGHKEHTLDSIKVFGHSLGDADYSYFRTLFDDVDLYDGDTALIFLYTAGANVTELNNNVAQLIGKYALTLPEEKQQINLITKLTLEGRLNIRYIPESEFKTETYLK